MFLFGFKLFDFFDKFLAEMLVTTILMYAISSMFFLSDDRSIRRVFGTASILLSTATTVFLLSFHFLAK